jgi:hypothetical protein
LTCSFTREFNRCRPTVTAHLLSEWIWILDLICCRRSLVFLDHLVGNICQEISTNWRSLRVVLFARWLTSDK